jgi:hypothetical protein
MYFSHFQPSPTFRRHLNKIFAAYIDVFVIVFLDDILIFGKTLEGHETYVRLVPEALNEATLFSMRRSASDLLLKYAFWDL